MYGYTERSRAELLFKNNLSKYVHEYSEKNIGNTIRWNTVQSFPKCLKFFFWYQYWLLSND